MAAPPEMHVTRRRARPLHSSQTEPRDELQESESSGDSSSHTGTGESSSPSPAQTPSSARWLVLAAIVFAACLVAFLKFYEGAFPGPHSRLILSPAKSATTSTLTRSRGTTRRSAC